MALTHKIIETRQYLDSWLSLVDINNSETGRIFHQRFNTSTMPTDQELAVLIDKAMLNIKKELDYEANDMNISADENTVMEYLRAIRSDMVMMIRQNPGCTLTQAQDYIAKKYPESIISFDKLYQFYLKLLKLLTWERFKRYIVSHKFVGID